MTRKEVQTDFETKVKVFVSIDRNLNKPIILESTKLSVTRTLGLHTVVDFR